MRAKLLLLCLLASSHLWAQQPLSQSLKTSINRYVYKITAKEALTLYKTKLEKINEQYLHTLLDSFPINDPVPQLKNGNYILLHADGGKQQYELIAVGDVQLKIINNKRDLAIALHQSNGTVIKDALVKHRGRKLSYHTPTQTYRMNNYRKRGNLQAVHDNTAFYFPLARSTKKTSTLKTLSQRTIHKFPLKYITRIIDRWQGYSHYNNYFDRQVPYERKFRGFMSFNKPIYKPGDTVRLKAFVMNRKGKGVKDRMLLRLTDRAFDIDTIIAAIKPYRPGGFTYEFVLNDSLDLDLDEEYLLTLEEERSRKYNINEYDGNLDDDDYANKRKIVVRGKFEYEEYELHSINFTARNEKKEHNRGNPLSVFLKATDENDLPIMDGRLQITVLPNTNNSIEFHAPAVFLPDTLWTHTRLLENVGETRIDLPDSIFPSATFNYQIECVLLNSNNERHTQQLYTKFIDKPEQLTFNLLQDSLFVEFQENGLSARVQAQVYAFSNKNDTLQTFTLQLPAAIQFNPYVSYYQAHAAGIIQQYQVKHTQSMVSALATRTKDSVFIFLNNPHRLPVWYTLLVGNKVIARGHADTLLIRTKTQTPKHYFLSLQYVYGNVVYNEDYTVAYQDKLLNVTVNAPKMVYPGQTTTIEVGVTDADGHGVAGADVTAYSFTRKFSKATPPPIPYLGKRYPGRKPGVAFHSKPSQEWIHQSRLHWERWSREMGLDTLEYYRFLYPDTLYRNKESVKDGSTQLAPFVVLKGELQPIHLLYIDEKPYFFSKSQNLQRYSFPVKPGKHSLRIRTHDRIITVNDINILNGHKTILSINGDASNKRINVQQAPDTLTKQERLLLTRYTILINNYYKEHFSYIEQGNNLFMLPRALYQHAPVPLIGPLLPGMANLAVYDQFRQPFEVEAGYLYQIHPGLIKQKQIHINQHISKWLSHVAPSYNFSDLVLTAQEVDSLWQDYLDYRSANEELFVNANLNKKGNGALRVEISQNKTGHEVEVKNIFLFRHDDTDFIRVYKGNSRDLGFLTPGLYRLLLLLKGESYLIQDSIYIQKDGLNYYTINADAVKLIDSLSKRLAEIMHKRELANRHNEVDLNDIKESFNTSFLDASTFTNTVFGRVRDENGHPIPFATVYIKGTRIATQTDADGYYHINAPAKGTIVFSYVGFATTERPIPTGQLDALLVKGSTHLEEVVVTGYGVSRKNSIAGSIATVNELSGRVPGVYIRGVSSGNESNTPLIVIDGVPYNGGQESLDSALLVSATVLKPDVGQALYGSRGAKGVILVTTKKGALKEEINNETNTASNTSLRRHFRDDAFWQPALRTNKEGKVKFTTTFPDDITNWRTFVIAIGNNKQTGFAESSIRSFRPISTNLSLPQFAVAGDSLNIIGKTLHYGTDSISLTRRIKISDRLIKEDWLHFRNSHLDTVSATITEQDSIAFRMEVQKADGYFDGEERIIPVYKRGVQETKGLFAALEGDTSFTIQLDPALGKITMYAEASLFPVLLDEAEKIYRYEYLCNEQLASKLKALLVQKKIYQLLKKYFKEEKAIADIISKLNNNKTGNLWGWWINNEPAPWISLHVVEALLQAEKDGYKVSLPRTAVIDNLVFNMEHYRGRDQLLTLHLLHQLNAKINFKDYIDSFSKNIITLPQYERLRLLELQQRVGIGVNVDSIIATAKHTLFGNLYWGEEGYWLFDNTIQNTILVYRILKAAEGQEATLRKIRNYFLEKRKDGQWRNTYESSLILETILPDLTTSTESLRTATLSFSDRPGEVIQTFPYQKEISGGEKMGIEKKGDLPLYFTAYQNQWNHQPKAVADAFTVHTVFETGDETTTNLKAGEPVNLKVHITAKGDADYVLIEIPIPAGCSYREKPQPRTNNEVHREYFKNKVSIFCSTLKQGSYTFTIPLLPRYTGKYHLNPAKAEMMYFPVFYGRESIKQVDIQ